MGLPGIEPPKRETAIMQRKGCVPPGCRTSNLLNRAKIIRAIPLCRGQIELAGEHESVQYADASGGPYRTAHRPKLDPSSRWGFFVATVEQHSSTVMPNPEVRSHCFAHSCEDDVNFTDYASAI